MPTIDFKGVSKSYGPNQVVKEFTASVPDKSFLVLLGPSGCGKSTMLRMIAGLIDITSGQLEFDGKIVNDLAPKRRNIAFVFQSYALYPHMSVRTNVAFPLVMDNFRWWHHIPIVGGFARRAIMRRPDVVQKVDEVAAMLELTPYLERKPKALSGGQRQRVALARSLVREPSVYLLDEPLSNLDAKLRTQMRAEISALHARVQKSFVYVTHDQVEAMTMGTHIIVLNEGVVQQHGSPAEIYDNPANVFVARFIGAPPMNLLQIEVGADGVQTADAAIPGSGEAARSLKALGHDRAQLGIRAEKLRVFVAGDGAPEDALDAYVGAVEHLGAETILGFKIGQPTGEPAVGAAASRGLYYAKIPGTVSVALGSKCRVDFSMADVVWFDSESGQRIDWADTRRANGVDGQAEPVLARLQAGFEGVAAADTVE